MVGADSMIGAALLRYLERAQQPAIGTSRRPHTPHLYLDLAAAPDTWHIPSGLRTAFLCAGIARLEACYQDPIGSAKVNVEGMVALAARLITAGVYVIFLSSDKVFNGKRPTMPADAPYTPTTVYGVQKVETEERILAMGGAVLRLSKVLGSKNPLFQSWATDLADGKVITPFSDLTLAPVAVKTVVTVLRLLADARLGGVWQLSGAVDTSYAEAANMAARLIEADNSLIHPLRAEESGLLSEKPNPYTSMDTSRLLDTFGFAPPPLQWILESVFFRPKVLEP